jgi:hypothetical protein
MLILLIKHRNNNLFFLTLLLKYMVMRKFIYLSAVFCLFVFSNEIFAQLYVSPSSYVFNKGAMVFVKQDINLQNTGNIYLRNEGQLLQGTTGSSSNTGLGKVSVFQEGTVNNYAYNYWCSPVGNASAASGNEDFGITMLNVPTTNTASTPAIMTSTSYNGVSSAGSLTISTYWIFRYLSSINYFSWLHSYALTNISAGQGFTMKGTSGTDATNVGETALNNPGSAQRYDFRGKPNDGNITINVGLNNYTLTGNPYSSAIDLNAFLTDPLNNTLDGTAIFWEQDKTVNSHNIAQYRGGNGVYNGTTSVYTPATFYTYDLAGNQGSVFSNPNNMYQRRFSPIGQGFMVRGAASGSAQMRNSYRVFVKEGVANSSQFERNANSNASTNYGFFDDIPNVAGIDYTQISKAPTPHFVVNTSLNSQAVRQIAICFLPNAIDGVDRADSKFPEQEANITTDMYLVLNSEPYVHSTTSFDENKRFPIGFKNSTTGLFTYTVKVNEFVNFNVDNVYLFDNVTGLYYDIKNDFHEVILPPGTHNNRFEITFKDSAALGVINDIKDDFIIVQNNPNQLLSITNPNSLDVKSVSLYDIAGKLIFEKVNLGTKSSYEFSTSSISEGVYVVKLQTTDNKSLGQKIIVERVN